MRYLILSLLVAGALLVASGCSGPRTPGKKDAYGRPIPAEMAIVTAAEIHANPQAYEGKDVLVRGTITSECPSGGWVWLKDETGDIYVNMHPTNIFIPQRVGKTVRAMGKVVLESGRPQVVGYGLEF